MACKNCNYSLKGDEKYCPSCGCRTENNEALTIDNDHVSTENFRLASVILGILSLGGVCFLVFAPISLILSVLGLIFAIKSNKHYKNIVGIILNSISLFLACIITIIFALILSFTVDVIENVANEYGNYIETYDNHGDF